MQNHLKITKLSGTRGWKVKIGLVLKETSLGWDCKGRKIYIALGYC
jgi:hypothetical protein